jgi:hypothetical protein
VWFAASRSDHSAPKQQDTSGHLEKYRFRLKAPIEPHVLVGVGLVHWSLQSRFFEVPFWKKALTFAVHLASSRNGLEPE